MRDFGGARRPALRVVHGPPLLKKAPATILNADNLNMEGDNARYVKAVVVKSGAVKRQTLCGKKLRPDQSVDPYLALQGFTSHAAYQYKEEKIKEKIARGMLADLVELDRNPLKVKPDEIKDIQVVRTIKRGKTVYAKSP